MTICMNALHTTYLEAEAAVLAAEGAVARARAVEAAHLHRLRTEHHAAEDTLHGCWEGARAVVEAEADLKEARARLDALVQFMDAV